MANPNIELVYASFLAYTQGDEEGLRKLFDPEGEIHGADGIVKSGTYRGYVGFRLWVGQWEEAWGEIRYDLGEISEVD